MLAFIRLIRPWNLLIIVLTMCVVRYCIISPVISSWGLHLTMKDLHFGLLIAAVTFIAAAGYIINDYFDVRIDRINKPGEVVVDKGVKRRVAMITHLAFNGIGVLLGIFVSWKNELLSVGSIIFIFAASALWFYSTDFKRKFLIGNIVVSLLSALIAFLPVLFELPSLALHFSAEFRAGGFSYNSIISIALALSIFAFLISWARELIKDMQDIPGDKEFGCKTFPIVLGVTAGKTLTLVLLAVVFAMIAIVQLGLWDSVVVSTGESIFESPGSIMLNLYLLGLQFMLIMLCAMTIRANTAAAFRKASMFTKVIMLAGICAWFLFAWFVQNGTWMIDGTSGFSK